MPLTLDAFELDIEDNAEHFVPITGAKRREIEAILAAAAQPIELAHLSRSLPLHQSGRYAGRMQNISG